MVALVSTSAALAATRTGTYQGETSQQLALSMTLSHRAPAGTHSRFLWMGVRSKLRYRCESGQGSQFVVQRYQADVQITVHPDGRFTIPLVAGTHSGRFSGRFTGVHVFGAIVDSFIDASDGTCRSELVRFSARRVS